MKVKRGEAPDLDSKYGNSRYCIFAILITQMPNAVLLGFNLGLFNTASPAIERYINNTYTKRYTERPDDALVSTLLTLAQSSLVWGSLVGSLTVSLSLNKLSRKISILLIHVINIVGVIFMAPIAYYGESYESLIVGRFVSGIARGMAFSVTMVVVAETTCRDRLGAFQAPFAVGILVTCSVGAAIGHYQVLGTVTLWIWSAIMPAIPSVVYILCYAWIVETPVYLLKSGKKEEALKVLRKLRVGRGEEDELKVLEDEISEQSNSTSTSLKTMMVQRHLRMQFFTALIAMVSPQLLGIQALLMYSDFLLIQSGIDPKYVSYATMALYLQSILAYAIFILLHRRFGTKKMFALGLCIVDVSLTGFTIAHYYHVDVPWTSYIALGCMFITIFGVQIGPQLCMHSLPSELTTNATRPKVAFYSGCAFWILGSLISLIFPYAVTAWKAIAYVPFVVIAVCLTVFAIFLIPETNNRNTAQIQSSFRKRSSQSFLSLFDVGRRFSSNNSNNSNNIAHENKSFENA